MNDSQTENVRPKRRWLQYSLRSLLVLTVVVAGGASWLAVRIKEAREQKQAVERISAVDGSVEYGDGGWLARVLGDDLIPVLKVSFRHHWVDDSTLRHMKSLARLEGLSACQTQITDAGLQHLQGLSQLRTLHLHFGKAAITDTGFQHLAHLTQLESLVLPGTIAVSDAGLQSLKGLTRLTRLRFRSSKATPKGVEALKRSLPDAKIYVNVKGCSEEEMIRLALTSEEASKQEQAIRQIYKAGGEVLFGPGFRHEVAFEDADPAVEVSFLLKWIADADLQHLTGLSRLEYLQIRGAHVGDAGLQHLKTLKHLKKLELYWSDGKITDAGLRHLTGLTQMETLQLGNTEVTDKGLSGLKELTRLKLLRLSSSRATKQGIEDLKRSLPNAEIDVRVKETSDEKRKPQADDGRREP